MYEKSEIPFMICSPITRQSWVLGNATVTETVKGYEVTYPDTDRVLIIAPRSIDQRRAIRRALQRGTDILQWRYHTLGDYYVMTEDNEPLILADVLDYYAVSSVVYAYVGDTD